MQDARFSCSPTRPADNGLMTEPTNALVEVVPDGQMGAGLDGPSDEKRSGTTVNGRDEPVQARSDRRGGAGAAVGQWLLASGLYLGLSVTLWWRVWTTHPSSVMTCGCTDAGREVWYLEWAAYAVAHGHNPWYSQWMLFPRGVNLLADASVSILGLAMAPVTLVFGPVASMNTLSTLAPVLTALSMFWLLRRWVHWGPAAFVGGLAYGYSSFVVVQLTFGWLNITFLALLPLMVGCLDELLVRQRHSPVLVGLALGLLAAAQFFVSSELLALAVIVAVIGVVVLTVYDRLHDQVDLRRRRPHALRGLVAAASTAAVALAVPVGFFLFGPARLGTLVWSTTRPGDLGNTLSNFVGNTSTWGPLTAAQLEAQMRLLGGYQGPTLPSPAFLGAGAVAALVVGTLTWRHDRRLWFWGAMGCIAGALSLRAFDGEWGPWALVDHVSILKNVWQGRFSAVIDLCAAVMLAIVVEHVWSAIRTTPKPSASPLRRGWAAVAAMAVAAGALWPVAAGLAPNVPFTVRPVALPDWFAQVGPHLPPGQVLLTYPMASSNAQTPLVWQAVDRMSFRLAGGGGPAATASRAGSDRVGFEVLEASSVSALAAPAVTAGNLEAARDAIRHWRVTTVVVPDQRQLPPYLRGRSNEFATALFTAVLGAAPRMLDHAWVWEQVTQDPGPLRVSGRAFTACVGDSPSGSQSAQCVLVAGDTNRR